MAGRAKNLVEPSISFSRWRRLPKILSPKPKKYPLTPLSTCLILPTTLSSALSSSQALALTTKTAPFSRFPPMHVTLKDVARQAGVSPKTVSRVVNHQGEISDETRLRVQSAIDDLG